MIIKQLIDEDFSNYKIPSMFIAFSHCSFKCDREYGQQICQNSMLAKSPGIKIAVEKVIDRYIGNTLTSALVIGGLEPFDDYKELYELVLKFRKKSDDDIVIYTGYYKKEIESKIKELSSFKNIVIKFGRYIPNQKKHYDEVLGIVLASDNQYAERIS